MIEKLTLTDLVRKYCKITGKWAVVLHPSLLGIGEEDFSFEELQKAVPFLDIENDRQAITDEEMIILCDSEGECWELFDQISGKCKPANNDYDGPCKVYAWTCGSNGEIMTENT